MLLADSHIHYLATKEAMIEPFFSSSVSRLPNGDPCTSYGLSSYGYDIRLGRSFIFYKGEENKIIPIIRDDKIENIYINSVEKTVINPNNFDPNLVVQINDVDRIFIPPKTYFMGVSLEYIRMPRNITAICNGKSTIARSGLEIFVTPLEAGWSGYITLEFFNATDSIMELTPGMGISQLCFLEGNTVCNTSYADRDGKYQNQGPHPIPPLKKLNTPSSLKVIK